MITGKMVYSVLAGGEVDCGSEEWRHECECRWLLVKKPTRSQKHRWLYGVDDRARIINHDNGELKDGWAKLTESKSITHVRGLAAADRILADARRIHESTAQAEQPSAQAQ